MSQYSKEAFLFISCFKKFKDKTLIINSKDRRISYNEFFENCLILKRKLEKKLKKNSRIFLVSNDTFLNFQLLIVCILSSFTLIPLDPSLSKDKKLNTNVWYDEKTLIWLKTSFNKNGKWEYRLKNIE